MESYTFLVLLQNINQKKAMTKIDLKEHQVWQGLTEIFEDLDTNALVTEHLELCNYKVCGYWDEAEEFYEEITLPRSLSTELVSSSIGVTGRKRWIQLKFVLKAESIAAKEQPSQNNAQIIGELILIYNENLEFVDENWQIDIDSPFVIANHQLQKS